MGSGLIYAVIVLLWAVVLVPMWLRRHDDVAEVRQVDRFSKAMRILSRRGEGSSNEVPAADEFTGTVITPESRDHDAAPTTSAVSFTSSIPAPQLASINLGPRRREDDDSSAQVFVSRPRSAQRRHEQATRRRNRQRILLGISGVVLVSLGLVGFGLVGIWLPGVALLLSAGYLVLLRREALADQRTQREASRQVSRPQRTAIDLTDSSVSGAGGRDAGAVAAELDAASVVTASVDAEVAAAWRPSSPPLPTYVTAPTATRVPRVIDRDGLSGLTAERMVELAEAARTPSGIDATPQDDEVWASATAEAPAVAAPSSDRDAVFDREWFETDIQHDGFADAVDDEAERIVGERPRRRHPSHDAVDGDSFDQRRAFGA